MARKPSVFPSYLLHKQSGQARVRIKGRDYLLGPFGSDESRIAYRRAITRACERLGIDRWVPHQLRHTNADVVREEFGLVYVQSVLGHAKANMSEHYAKASRKKAAEVARKIG